MRKFYNLLLLAMVFIVSATVGQAQKRYGLKGGDGTLQGSTAWNVDEIDLNTPVALQSGYLNDESKDFASTSVKTTTLKDENIFVFETDGTNADNFDVYLLKNVATGKYLARETANATFTDTKARAWRFCIKEAHSYTTDDINNVEAPVVEDWTTATTVTGNSQAQLVFVDASATIDTTVTKKTNVVFLCTSQGSAPSFGRDFGKNTWEVFPVEEITGYKWLKEAMSEYFPDEETTPADLYNVGEDAGEISQELFDELTESFDAAKALITSESTDQSECEAAYKRLVAALQAAKDGAVKIKEGYFYFRSNRNENNATYDNGTGLKWTYGQTWTKPEHLDMANAKYVWHLIPDAKNDGAYFIQNYYTKRYVGVATAVGQSVPTTEEPKESYLIYPQNKDAFVIESTSLIKNPVKGYPNQGSPDCTALHCPGDHNNVVVWISSAEASGWTFTPIPESEIEALAGQIDQDKRNTALQSLYDQALAKYQSGFSYASAATKDGKFTSEGGLVTKAEQFFSNAQETSEGSKEGLIDDDPTTFFHSNWSAKDNDYGTGEAYHYLGVDLGKALKTLTLKFEKRVVNSGFSPQFPTKVDVYASNDTTGTGNWVKQGSLSFSYNYPIYREGVDTLQNGVAISSIDMSAAYRYLRLDVVTTGNGNKFFNLGGAQVYEAKYDAATSMIEAVDKAVRTEFETQMAAAKKELEAKAATTATTDALKKAYDAFVKAYPDPATSRALLNEAKGQIRGAKEGTDPGYFQAGAIAALQAVVDANEPKVKDVMTLDEVNAVNKALTDALNAFAGKLILPEVGAYYYIKSESSSTAEKKPNEGYIYALGNGATVKWTGKEDLAAVELSSSPQYVWKFEKQGKGYTFRNMLTGEYLNNPKKNNVVLSMSTQADTCAVTFRSAKIAGIFNIVLAEDVFVNAQPGYNNVVTWNYADSLDNSAFSFVKVDPASGDAFSGSVNWPIAAGKLQILTLPVTVEVGAEPIYTVIGRNGNNLELKLAEGNIAAGTPFFYNGKEAEDAEATTINLVTKATTLDELAADWATEAKEVNGLHGTLARIDSLHLDYGVLYNNTTIVNSELGQSVANNSGYITPQLPATTETGTLQVPIDGTIDAIEGVTTEPAAQKIVNVYNLSGVRVRTNVKSQSDLQGLPSGIYIMGNKKVLVK